MYITGKNYALFTYLGPRNHDSVKNIRFLQDGIYNQILNDYTAMISFGSVCACVKNGGRGIAK